jgi:thiamine-monophosphate kinase
MGTVFRYGENGLVARITKEFKTHNPSTVKGIGNDASVINNIDRLTLVSTDMLLEGIHFNLTYFPLKHLGYKCVVRAISDIFAMNGTPNQLLVGIGASSRFQAEAIEDIYAGIKLGCEKYGIDLVGGDTTGSLTGLTITVTAVGSVENELLVTRDGAETNDLICVTGDLGGAYMGLQILEREKEIFEKNSGIQPDLSGADYVIGRQLKPEIPVDILGKLKDEEILPTAMIDLTNGLATDIMQLCGASGVGCKLFPERIPIDTETSRFAEDFHIEPLIPALNGGDDFEMLFTAPLTMHEKISRIKGVSIIGHITEKEEGLRIVGDDGTSVELNAPGWQ